MSGVIASDPQPQREPMDRVFAWIEAMARAAREPDGSWCRWLRWGRWSVGGVSFLYLLVLIIGLSLVQWIGERYWVFSILLLLPPLGWLLPLAILTPLCLVLWPKICLLHLLAPAYLLVVFIPFHWSRSVEPTVGGEGITVVVNNMGDRRTRTLFPLVEEFRPDIIALQEGSVARGRALARVAGNPGMQVVQHGHLTLISRFPITASGLVEGISYRGTPAAAWFELDYEGETIVVYNVHLPTPRHDLERLRGRGFLYELPRGGGIYSGSVRAGYRESLRERVRLAEELAAFLGKERRAHLALGDFNAASQGYVRRLFSARLTDGFATAGRGWGLTFPGVTRNPISFFGPWLRIDYIFASSDFRLLDCRVERREAAKHRALAGRIELDRSSLDSGKE